MVVHNQLQTQIQIVLALAPVDLVQQMRKLKLKVTFLHFYTICFNFKRRNNYTLWFNLPQAFSQTIRLDLLGPMQPIQLQILFRPDQVAFKWVLNIIVVCFKENKRFLSILQGSAGISGSQTYNLPNGQKLNIAYTNGFSSANGKPSTSQSQSINFS